MFDSFYEGGHLDYSRVEIAAAARQWPMKLYEYTANGLQRSRCCEIGSPEGEKLPIPICPIRDLKN